MRKTLLVLSLAISLLAPIGLLAQTVKITAAERKAAEGVTAEQLSNYLYFVASDAMGGRDTPSQGLDVTAEFIRMNLQKWGFKPAGDEGTFFQRIALGSETVDTAKTNLSVGGTAYKLGDDFVRITGSGSADGKLVFGGSGWMVKAKNLDGLSGIDVGGKIVVFAPTSFSPRSPVPLPSGVTQEELKGTRGLDWADPIANAAAKGAKAVIIIAPPATQSNWGRIRGLGGRGNLYPEKLRPTTAAGPSIPVLLVSQPVGDAIFASESGGDRASSTVFSMTKNATTNVAVNKDTVWTQNVVAVWEGSDPILKNEMVAIGAHYDHVGTNPSAPGSDKIWNGADDDGSGTVAVLSIAEALSKAQSRPKRSVLFVWHCGEEKGLWGSDYFNRFPTVDIKNVIAQLNIDMIGRSRKEGDA